LSPTIYRWLFDGAGDESKFRPNLPLSGQATWHSWARRPEFAHDREPGKTAGQCLPLIAKKLDLLDKVLDDAKLGHFARYSLVFSFVKISLVRTQPGSRAWPICEMPTEAAMQANINFQIRFVPADGISAVSG
jgi:hypothetical protein